MLNRSDQMSFDPSSRVWCEAAEFQSRGAEQLKAHSAERRAAEEELGACGDEEGPTDVKEPSYTGL